MMKRLLATTLWLMLGHACLGGLFWLLLQVPESNVLMLGASALIVLLFLAGAGWVETTAVVASMPGRSWRRSLTAALAALPFFFLALVLAGGLWWLTGIGFRWAAVHRTEIDAWLMARWGWTQTAWVHATLAWLLRAIRYALGASLTVTLVAAGAAGGWRAIGTSSWLRQALAPRCWLAAGIVLLVLIWLPWQAVTWRPALVPPTFVEPLFVGVKLSLIYVVLNAGWALVLAVVAGRIAMPCSAVARPEVS